MNRLLSTARRAVEVSGVSAVPVIAKKKNICCPGRFLVLQQMMLITDIVAGPYSSKR